jgi:hypothetical protein
MVFAGTGPNLRCNAQSVSRAQLEVEKRSVSLWTVRPQSKSFLAISPRSMSRNQYRYSDKIGEPATPSIFVSRPWRSLTAVVGVVWSR